MSLLSVSESLCIKCGLCAAVCPRGLISLTPEWPAISPPELCIACGQCVAICPAAALDHARSPLSGQSPLKSFPVLDGETARQYLRSRRSVRCYRPEPVSRAKLAELLDIARFAPTGGNSQGISYLAIDKPDLIQRLAEQTILWMESPAMKESPAAKTYGQYVRMYRQSGRDSILRDAPCLVLATADRNFARGRENSIIALTYVELYAPAIGLGTCWAGLLEAAVFSGFPPLLELLSLPEERQFTGALMVGYPKLVFRRLADRNPLKLSFLGD